MKIRLYTLPAIAVLLIISFSSCKKYLDEKSNKSLVVPSSIDDLQGLLDNEFYMNTATPGFGQTSDDDYFMTEDTYNAVSDMDRQAYTWQLKEYTYPNGWASCYSAVYNSNYCLDKLQNIDVSLQNASKWNNVKGSAYFFRAYYFLNLVWEFGKAYDENTSSTDPGIVLRLGSDFNVPSVRASVKASYDQVILDLKEANKYLPDNPIHPMRPSKAASYGVLARAYLSMRQYDSAYKYAAMALQIKNDILDYNSPEVDPSSPVPFQPYNKEIIFYSTQAFSFLPIFSLFSFADSTLFESYNDNDLRKTVFYFPQGDYYSFKGHYSSNPYLLFSGITTAEMILIQAEYHARAGMLSEAANDLNTLLPNRWITGTYIPLSFTSPDQAKQAVLDERRKELTMRGLRWIDIKRLNKEGAGITLMRRIGGETFILTPDDSRYALPIPKDIIEITGIQQN